MKVTVTKVTMSSPDGDNEDAMKFTYSDGVIDYVNNVGPITNRVRPDGTRNVIGTIEGRSDYDETAYDRAQEEWNGEGMTEMTDAEYKEWEVNQPKLG